MLSITSTAGCWTDCGHIWQTTARIYKVLIFQRVETGAADVEDGRAVLAFFSHPALTGGETSIHFCSALTDARADFEQTSV